MIYEPDHKARTFEDTFSKLKDQDVTGSLLRAVAKSTQLLEDISFDYAVSNSIDSDDGYLLRRWGLLVGERQGTLTTEEFRRVIRAKILALRSSGLIDNITQVVDLLTNPTDKSYATTPPAAFRISYKPTDPISDALANRIVRLVDLARPAGVGADVIEEPVAGVTFRLDDADAGLDNGLLSRKLT